MCHLMNYPSVVATTIAPRLLQRPNCALSSPWMRWSVPDWLVHSHPGKPSNLEGFASLTEFQSSGVLYNLLLRLEQQSPFRVSLRAFIPRLNGYGGHTSLRRHSSCLGEHRALK